MKVALMMAVAGVLTLGIASPTDTSSRHEQTAKRPATVLALRYSGRSAELLRVDRKTLRPLHGSRVTIGAEPGAWALSPDRSRLAIGSGRALGLRIVDVRRMRRIADVQTRNGSVSIVGWLTPTRIVGVEETGLFVVDPVRRRLLRSESLDGSPYGAARFGDALVLLLSSGEGVGPARLALVDADGGVRSVVLDRILAGFENPSGDRGRPFGASWRPGLAIDAAGGRAFVVGGGAPVAEVDLRSLSVRYHDLARPASLLGRLRDWLEPQAHAKGPVAGSWRTARWLGGNRLAFTGEDGRALPDGNVEVTAVGLNLVDTSAWSAKTLDTRANGMTFAAGTLVGTRHGFEVGRGIGLVAFDRDGSRRFHLLGDARLSIMDTLDQRVFVDDETRTRAADLTRGRLVPSPRTVPVLLVGSMSSY